MHKQTRVLATDKGPKNPPKGIQIRDDILLVDKPTSSISSR